MTFDNLPSKMEQALSRMDELDAKVTTVINLFRNLPIHQETDQRFFVRELASYLGCSEVTINRYVKDNQIPYHRINRTLYFLKSEIDNHSSSKRTKFRMAC